MLGFSKGNNLPILVPLEKFSICSWYGLLGYGGSPVTSQLEHIVCWDSLTLMLVVANFANTKTLKNHQNPRTWVLI